MSKELLMVIDAVANEKDLEKTQVIKALEDALFSVVRKKEDEGAKIHILLDPDTGDVNLWRYWKIVADDARIENPMDEIRMMDVSDFMGENDCSLMRKEKINHDDFSFNPGDELVVSLPNPLLDRITAQTTKQVLLQKIKEIDRQKTVNEFKDRVNDILTGVVKRFQKGQIYVDLGGNREGVIPYVHQIKGERFKVGERIRASLFEVNSQGSGPSLILSRTSPEFVLGLMRIEIPEAGNGTIELHACARDPGDRAKVAVSTKDPRLDPIGACIGMRGSRIQSVSSEIHGERIDVVLWDESFAQFVANAMAPGEVEKLIIDEESHTIEVAVAEGNLSRAIGRGGQNVKLASRLTGWHLNVQDIKNLNAKQEKEEVDLKEMFMKELSVDDEMADILFQEGFSSLEEIAYVPIAELLSIEGFDDEIVEALRERAQDSLLNSELSHEEEIKELQDPLFVSLLQQGMTQDELSKLIDVKIDTASKLADLSIDEVCDLIPEFSLIKDKVGHWIQEVRKSWF